MSDYITKVTFEQMKKRIDDKFEHLSDKIDDLSKIMENNMKLMESNVKYQISEMKNIQFKWFIGTMIAIAGVAGKVFGLYWSFISFLIHSKE